VPVQLEPVEVPDPPEPDFDCDSSDCWEITLPDDDE
jgi:hypothetical protein